VLCSQAEWVVDLGQGQRLVPFHHSGSLSLVVEALASQSDLAHRSETGTEKRRKWWLELFADPDEMAREYVKSHGHKAQNVMTRLIVSVSENARLAEVANCWMPIASVKCR
jgi:hypothetical protein